MKHPSHNLKKRFIIHRFRDGEEKNIAVLVKTVFDQFVAPGYTDKGNNFFYDFIDPVKIVLRQRAGNLLLSAKNNGKVIGMIEVRDKNHICLLFVDPAWHRRGVAKRLFNEALKICRNKSKNLTYFEVNASPFSENRFYAKLGFVKEKDLQEINGMKFVPMRMELK